MTDQKEDKKPEQNQKDSQNQINFIWIVLGIGAILLIWLLSSWVYN